MSSTESSILTISMKNNHQIGSSQFRLFLKRLCMIWRPFNKKGASGPRGSYTLLKAASKPCLVTGLWLILIWNPRVSSPTFHLTPRTLFAAKTNTQPLSLTPFFLYLSWILFETSKLLLKNFVMLHPLSLHNSLAFPGILIDSSIGEKLFSNHQHKSFALTYLQHLPHTS